MTQEGKLTWFQLMWKNNYIQLFLVGLATLIAVIFCYDTFYELAGFVIALMIPALMMTIIAYKAFYQFWRDYKKEERRCSQH